MVKWEAYDETLPRNAYEKVHYDQVTDDLAMDHQGFKDRDAVTPACEKSHSSTRGKGPGVYN